MCEAPLMLAKDSWVLPNTCVHPPTCSENKKAKTIPFNIEKDMTISYSVRSNSVTDYHDVIVYILLDLENKILTLKMDEMKRTLNEKNLIIPRKSILTCFPSNHAL